MNRTALAFMFAGWLASVGAVAVAADEPVATPPPEAPASPAVSPAPSAATPSAIPPSEIPRAAIAAETRMRAIRSLAGRTRETDEIAASSAAVLDSVARLEELMRTREPGQQTNRALRSLAQEWRLNQDHLAGWMETTSHRLDALTAASNELDALTQRWTMTAAALQADAPLEIIERTHGILETLDEVGAQIHAQVEAALLLESRISAAKLDSEEALESITAMVREEHKALFKIDSPPIWKAFATTAGQPALSSQIRESVRDNRRALRQYAERARTSLQLQVGLFVLLAAIFFRLRQRSRSWPQNEKGIVACKRLVARPIFGALLVALLSGIWIHPRAPLVFYELSSALLVVPIVVVMGGIVQPRVRGALYLLAAIFVVERAWESTSAGSLLERMVLFGMTFLSIVVLAWTIRPPAVLTEVVASRWWRAVTFVGRVALVGLAVSLLSNIAGNVTLARLLTATVIRAAYWAVVLYAAALLLRGMISLLVRAPELSAFHALERNADQIVRRAWLAIDTLAVVFFLLMSINATGQWPVVMKAVEGGLTHKWGFGDVHFSFGSVLLFVLAVLASIVVSRLVCTILEADVYPRVTLPRGVPGTVTTVVRYTLIAAGFLLASAIVGVPLDRMAFVLGAFSVGIGFGLQTVINNFVSGLILMFERPIQVGDTVDVAGLVGRVRHIGVRASRIETADGAEVIVPNGTLVSNPLINWTLSSRNRRIEIQVSVPQEADAALVMAAMREAVTGQPDVLAKPAPSAVLRKLGADTTGKGILELSVFFWTGNSEEWIRIRSDMTVRVNQAVQDALNAATDLPPKLPEVPSRAQA